MPESMTFDERERSQLIEKGNEILRNIVREVYALAQESPDCKYVPQTNKNGGTSYSYVEGQCTNGSRGCLIGQAIVRSQPNEYAASLEDVEEWSFASARRVLPYVVSNAGAQCGAIATSRYVRWLSFVQHQQDEGAPWGRCVAIADRDLSGLRRELDIPEPTNQS